MSEPRPFSKAETLTSLMRRWPRRLPLPIKYNDGFWWCDKHPGCDPVACCGHSTFGDAVRLTMAHIDRDHPTLVDTGARQ